MQQQSLAVEAIEPRHKSRRASVLRVRCHGATEQDFVQRYAADISASGMFLRTRQPLPVGARVRFELLLQCGRCALGGVGRVAWIRDADPEQGRRAGGGIAFERLRRGDRAVIERMDVVRGSTPSRFEQPEAMRAEAPHGVELAKTLFGDLGPRVADPGAAVFLSEDLSQELGDGGWRLGIRSGAEHPIADLAEQLEPSAELRDAELRDHDDDADDDAEVDVEIVEPPSARDPAAAHSTVRPAPISALQNTVTDDARSGIATGAGRSKTPLAAPSAPSAVYAVSADSAVSLALARSAVSAVNAGRARPVPMPERPGNGSNAANGSNAVNGSTTRTAGNGSGSRSAAELRARLQAASPARSGSAAVKAKPVAPAPAPVPALVRVPDPPVVEALPAPTPSQSPRPQRSSAALVIALSAVIVLASGVTYLALSDQLPHVLAWLGL